MLNNGKLLSVIMDEGLTMQANVQVQFAQFPSSIFHTSEFPWIVYTFNWYSYQVF